MWLNVEVQVLVQVQVPVSGVVGGGEGFAAASPGIPRSPMMVRLRRHPFVVGSLGA